MASSGCSPSIMLPNSGKELSRMSKVLLPIIAKQKRVDGNILVMELYQASLIPWASYDDAMHHHHMVFLDKHVGRRSSGVVSKNTKC
eukprot:jgi/Botrbrau1/18586/Bobra.0367s0028.1